MGTAGPLHRSADLGRFAQPDSIVPDPYNPQSLNRYSYTLNNPVKYVDPDGHDPYDPLIVGVAKTIWTFARAPTMLVINVVELATSKDRVYTPISPDQAGQLPAFMKAQKDLPIAQSLRENFNPWPLNLALSEAGFVALVRPGGKWDFKPDLDKAGIKRVKFGNTLGKEEFNYQAVANIYFGFEGSRMGQSSLLLQSGAGAAQWLAWFRKNPENVGPGPGLGQRDDPSDNWWVRFGIYLHERYGDDLDGLNEDTFGQALDDFIQDSGEPPDPLTEG